MNLTEDEEEFIWTTKAIWQRAENPDVGVTFFVLSGIWMAFNFTVGVVCNGAVLVTYFKNSEVCSRSFDRENSKSLFVVDRDRILNVRAI